jgi:hypothetical protein
MIGTKSPPTPTDKTSPVPHKTRLEINDLPGLSLVIII